MYEQCIIFERGLQYLNGLLPKDLKSIIIIPSISHR